MLSTLVIWLNTEQVLDKRISEKMRKDLKTANPNLKEFAYDKLKAMVDEIK